MTFEPKKFNEVFEEMRDRTSAVTDFEVGSVTRNLYESFAYEIALLYEKMQLVYLSAYVDTAEGQQLDMVVAILGIQRGLPDFAEGEVTFERDIGNQDIPIPSGTLVATLDKPESPKKVYQTSEAQLFPKDRATLAVRVQAVNRGEEAVTPEETLVVMPRPIPGIKSVSNPEATRFTGKRRETDEQLRQRAKNTLISSGKATILAIENALLSLPSVKEAKVKENFHFARGEVTLTRSVATNDLTIPKGTLLVTETGKQFVTTAQEKLAASVTSRKVQVQSLLEGKAGEVLAGATWHIQGDDLSSLSASNVAPLQLGEFGVIEVFVDGIDFSQEEVVGQLQKEIDRVRAAGIFVLLKSTETVNVDGVFKIALRPDLKFSPQEREKLETSVRDEIIKYIESKQMGQPLLFPQIIKSTLSLDGIDNLEDFLLTISRLNPPQSLSFHPNDRQIEIEESERLNPRYLCVASETKPLPVDIQFKATELDKNKRENIQTALAAYFKGLKIGEKPDKFNDQIAKTITDTGVALTPNSLKLIPKPWCQHQNPPQTGEIAEIAPSFVEKLTLGDVFAYSKVLQITGAIRLILPSTLTDSQKQEVHTQVRDKITAYLEGLKPEVDVVFADLIAIAALVKPVVAVNLEPSDFQVLLDEAATVGRVSPDGKNIVVQEFEKAQLVHFCITSEVLAVRVEITNIVLELVGVRPSRDLISESVKTALQNATKNAIINFFASQKAGQKVVFDNLKNALDNLVTGLSYTVNQLDLTATSECDNRTQVRSLAIAQDIQIRSVEIAVLNPIDISKITIDDKTIPPPAGVGG